MLKSKLQCRSESRVLLDIGRHQLEIFLAACADQLNAKKIHVPDSSLPDEQYLPQAERALLSIGAQMWQKTVTNATPAADPPEFRQHEEKKPRYRLVRGLGVWHLTFDGKEVVLKHEKGLLYVAWLLYNTPEHPIHALDLMAKIPEIYGQQLGLLEIADPSTGKATTLCSHARIQERSLALDDAQAVSALLRKQKKLETILDSEEESEPVKAEALREMEAISEFLKSHATRTNDTAAHAGRAVRRAISRLHQHLRESKDVTHCVGGSVLQQFAVHLQDHLIIPSARYVHSGASRAIGPIPGRFTYEAPRGITWVR